MTPRSKLFKLNDINCNDADQVLRLLVDIAAVQETEIESVKIDGDRTESDEETDSTSTVIYSCSDGAGTVGIAQMANFSKIELDRIYDLFAPEMERR